MHGSNLIPLKMGYRKIYNITKTIRPYQLGNKQIRPSRMGTHKKTIKTPKNGHTQENNEDPQEWANSLNLTTQDNYHCSWEVVLFQQWANPSLQLHTYHTTAQVEEACWILSAFIQ